MDMEITLNKVEIDTAVKFWLRKAKGLSPTDAVLRFSTTNGGTSLPAFCKARVWPKEAPVLEPDDGDDF